VGHLPRGPTLRQWEITPARATAKSSAQRPHASRPRQLAAGPSVEVDGRRLGAIRP